MAAARDSPFDDNVHFPDFDSLPDYDSPWGEYYTEHNGTLTPSRHWCFLGEIVSSMVIGRPRVWVRSGSRSDPVIVHFYHDASEQPTTFDWTDMKAGHTVAILYAKSKMMMDMSTGIRQEHLDGVFVFRSNMAQVKLFALQLTSPPRCFAASCDVDVDLLRCARCHATYCSKDHQVQSWSAGHKRLCSQAAVIEQLVAIMQGAFLGFYNFRFELEAVDVDDQEKRSRAAMDEWILKVAEHVPRAVQSRQVSLLIEYMLTQTSWREQLRATGLLGRLLDQFVPDIAFDQTPAFQILKETMRRLNIGSGHALIDPITASSSRDSITFVEAQLGMLPRWGVAAGARMNWMIQVQHPSMYKAMYDGVDGWSIVGRDDPYFMLAEHAATGTSIQLTDEPQMLFDETVQARRFTSPWLLRVMVPSLSRIDATLKMLTSTTANTPATFTAWIRVDDVLNSYVRPFCGYGDETEGAQTLSGIRTALCDRDPNMSLFRRE
eukprot:jgi/Mesvir1/3177/Mv16335-RA.1